jgi:Trp operon repressor
MTNSTQSQPFFKVLKEHLKLGGNEAILLAYIAEFEAQGLDCFASRKRISQELNWGESTVQRTIKSLLKTGHVTISRNGWKRLLHSAKGVQNEPGRGSNRTRGGSKMNHQGGSKRTTNLVQNEPIQRSITNNNNKETIQSLSPFERQKLELLNMGVNWDDIPE